MIGIIGAMTVEVEGLNNNMTEKKVKTVAGTVFTEGKLAGKDVVTAISSEGKVNAAMCTQAMILEYSPDVIINTGVGGGVGDGLKIGDIVIGTSVVEHDMDMSPLGHPAGYICGIDGIYMDCNPELCRKLTECVDECGIPYKTGVIASGDQFISDSTKKQWLRETFSAMVCEMEGGAIGHVCQKNDIPFAVLRAISDGGDDEAKLSFPEFMMLAAQNSIKVLTAYMQK